MKKKSLTMLLSGLLTVSLTGVGFASWYIVNSATAQEANGNIVVEKFETKDITISNVKLNTNSLKFGSPSTTEIATAKEDGVTYSWLKNEKVTENGTELDEEIMSVTITFDVENYALASKIDATFEVVDGGTSNFSGAVEATYLNDVSTTINEVSSEGSYSFTFEYEWGDAFDNENPFYYYNRHAQTDMINDTTTYGADANTKLSDFYSKVNGASFKITVTAEA